MNQTVPNYMDLFLDLVGQGKDLEIMSGVKMFLTHTKAERSIQTFNYYKKHLKVICDYLKERGITKFSQINTHVIDNFVLYSKRRKRNKNITINKRICALKTVTVYLTKIQLLLKPLQASKLKEKIKKIVVLSPEEITRVVEYTKALPVKNQVMIELLLQTGIRRTELCKIKTKNIDLKNNWIYLSHTKTNSPRYIYFDDHLKFKIASIMKSNSVFLFTSKGNRALSPSTLDSLFERMKKRLNIKMLSPHLLRHTFATYILKNGGNLEAVRVLLGHASYQMTQRYLHLLQEELKETSIMFNPMASL